MYLNGTKGSIEFSIHGRYDIKIKKYSSDNVQVIEMPDPKVVEEPMIQSVVQDLLQQWKCMSMAEDASPIYKIIDQILDTFYQGRDDDFWNYPERWGN